MSSYAVTHQKARSFYPIYERKAELQHQTHYCPGCGHGVVHKLIARAIDELGIQDRTILISPVGCSVFAYYYFDVGNIQVAHGRAPAVATAVKRSCPQSVVLSYQGDGDLAAIGCAEIVHAANRGEPISVIFVNNAIYGMTGGQMAPTTPLGVKTTTSPFGRTPWNEGYPMRVSELLASLEAPVYIERVALGNNKQVMNTGRAVRRAIENQVRGLGFSLVEVLSPCPTIWKLDPLEAQRRVLEELPKTFPLGVFRDRTKEAQARPSRVAPPPLSEIPQILGLTEVDDKTPVTNHQPPATASIRREATDARLKIAGFGGQGVLLLGEVLAEAGLAAGLEVSWLPSYGPEMRSGTSNCHVRLSSRPIDSPLVSVPNVLLAMNEPSLRKFIATVQPGGWVIYNGTALPGDCARADVHTVALPFTHLGDELGAAKAANIVMLGALLEATDMLTEEQVITALGKLVKSPRWIEIDLAAMARGRQEARKEIRHEN
ncbi:MAG TPA: 2-oxoacid:acceptor oxidoreductase family protein [Bryobacteraceae bacterium]|jgi:2-oxoisovalerate ferredoxin oxidoreductase beta subunit|nr:2-oxoacid:acceptor oxidoreductase family protein [Bryobacteraceae bacterium]